MKPAGDEIANPDERVVAVREVTDDVETTFYAIRDVALGYWRSAESVAHYAAWTRDRKLRAEFDTREEAEAALEDIHDWRRRTAC